MTAKMAIIEIVKNFKIELSPDTKVRTLTSVRALPSLLS